MSNTTVGESTPRRGWAAPLAVHNFQVTLDGQPVGNFTQCSAPDVRIDTVEYREGGISQVVHHIPTIPVYAEMTLRQGLTPSRRLWDWFVETLEGGGARLPLSIIVLDSRGSVPAVTWNFYDALPTRFAGAELNANAREVYVQEFGFKYESLERARSDNG